MPEGNRPYGAMMLGRPKYDYSRIPLRKEPDIQWDQVGIKESSAFQQIKARRQ